VYWIRALNRKVVYVGQGNSNHNWSVGGIGTGLVEGFPEGGYNVVATSRNAHRKLTTSSSLVLVDGDIGKQQTAAYAVEAAINNFGTIDVLVDNAGIFLTGPFTEFTTEDIMATRLDTLAGLLDSRKLTTEVGTVLPLEEARKAREMLAGAPHKRGKIVPTIHGAR
jgi:NAD(P)-dependent dehydrogenase (short-subunit alcohol dehydrogenase family)